MFQWLLSSLNASYKASVKISETIDWGGIQVCLKCHGQRLSANPKKFLFKCVNSDGKGFEFNATDAVARINYLNVYNQWVRKLAGIFSQ